MKTPTPNPKEEAGAPGKGAAIVTRPAKSGNSASEPAALVTVERGQPVTTTERVAAAAGLQHASVIKLVREHLADFEEFGPIRFQIRMGTRGGVPVEYAELNEQQAALLFLYQRNTAKVRAFKLRMVKDFARVTSELQRLKAMQSAPSWRAARVETKRDFCNVADMLQEARADAGKDTGRVHHMNEAKLIRFALTGSETAKWDRDTLSREDLKLLGKVERLDMRLIARGMPFHDRKASCRALVLEARGLLLKGAA